MTMTATLETIEDHPPKLKREEVELGEPEVEDTDGEITKPYALRRSVSRERCPPSNY
jgi:hypothetical protein